MQKLISFIKARKNFIVFTMLKLLIMVIGLATNIFIVRKLSVRDNGIFSVAFMFIGLVTTFGFSWSSSSILYYGSRERAETGSINKTFWARNIIIFFSLIIATILFVLFRNDINGYIGLDVYFLILIWLYISVVEDYLSQYFLAVKKQLLSSILSLTAKIIYIALIIILPFDVKRLIILNIISHGTVLLYVIGINKKDIGRFEFDKDWFKQVLNFSLWQLFGFSGLYLINFADTAVIKHYMTLEDVSIYNTAYKLFDSVAGFAFVISSYYAGSVSHYFAKNEHEKIKKFYYKERLYIVTLSSIIHLIVMTFSKQIFKLLYGERYIQSVVIFNVLMIGSIFRYLSVFYMLYFNTNGKHKVQQYLNIFRSILNVVLDIVLINMFGLIGPAIATTIAIIATAVFSALICEKKISAASKGENV